MRRRSASSSLLVVSLLVAAACGNEGAPTLQEGEEAETMGVSEQQSMLRPDQAAVVAYAKQHPDSWAGVRFVNEPRVVIQVAFTGDLEPHRLALSRLVEHPDRVEVVPSARSLAELERIREQVEAALRARSPNPMLSFGQGWLQLDLHLSATAEALAAELHERFGDAIAITVGSKPYPDRGEGRMPCPEVPQTTGNPLPIAVRLRLHQATLQSGETAGGVVEVTNTGDRALTLETDQPLVGSVLDAARTTTVGVHVGAIAGTGLRLSLEPGATAEVEALIGTASCVQGAGYRLPAGTYAAAIALPVRERRDDGMPVIATVAVEPVAIELRD